MTCNATLSRGDCIEEVIPNRWSMGVGKTTISQLLKKQLNNSVFLDGDWCWDSHPFQVTDETKTWL